MSFSGRESSKSPYSSRSRYSAQIINDLKKKDSRYVIKKLSRDKSKMKEKFRQLVKEMDYRDNKYRTSTHKLLTEKDQFLQEIEKLRFIVQQQTKSLQNLEQTKKLGQESEIERMEQTQEQIVQQTKDLQNLQKQEKKWRQKVVELEEKLSQLESLYSQERQEIQQLTSVFAKEREQNRKQWQQEKEEEIGRIVKEKDSIIESLYQTRNQLNRQIKNTICEKDSKVEEVEKELEKIRSDCEKKIYETADTYGKKIRETIEDYEQKINQLRKEEVKRFHTSEQEWSKKFTSMEKEYKNNNVKCKCEIDKLHTELRTQQNLASRSTNELKEIKIQNEELIAILKKEHEKDIIKVCFDSEVRISEKQKELEKECLLRQKVVGELQDTNKYLQDQNTHLNENLRSVQNMNNQLVGTLNKQKETYEIELATKETRISELMVNMQKLSEETVEKFGFLNGKMKTMEIELENATEKYRQSKYSVVETEKIVTQTRQTVLKHEETVLKLKGKIFELEADIKISEKKNKDLTNEKMIQEAELVQLKTQTRRTLDKAGHKINLADDETKKFEKENTILRDTVDSLNKDFDRNKREIELIVKQNSQLGTDLKEMKKERDNLRQEIDKLRPTVTVLVDKESEITQLNRHVAIMQQEYKHTLNRLTSEHKKERDELQKLRESVTVYQNQEDEVQRLRSYLNKVQTMQKNEIEKMEKIQNKEIKELQARLNSAELQLTTADQRVAQTKLDYMRQLIQARKLTPEDQEKYDQLVKEYDKTTTQLEKTEKRLEKIQFEFANASAVIKNRTTFLDEREHDLKQLEERLRTAAPKILDPTLKQGRDAALAGLRKAKVELGQTQEQVLELTQKLHVAEGIIRDIEKEKRILADSQNELKRTFVDSLNQQQTNHENEIDRCNNRIKELESLVFLQQKIS